jgi:hypothetical protein
LVRDNRTTTVCVDWQPVVILRHGTETGEDASPVEYRRRFTGCLEASVARSGPAVLQSAGACRIEQRSGGDILLNQGTIYAALVRLQQRGWIAAD